MFRRRVWKIWQCSFLQIFESSGLKFIKFVAVFINDLFVGHAQYAVTLCCGLTSFLRKLLLSFRSDKQKSH